MDEKEKRNYTRRTMEEDQEKVLHIESILKELLTEIRELKDKK